MCYPTLGVVGKDWCICVGKGGHVEFMISTIKRNKTDTLDSWIRAYFLQQKNTYHSKASLAHYWVLLKRECENGTSNDCVTRAAHFEQGFSDLSSHKTGWVQQQSTGQSQWKSQVWAEWGYKGHMRYINLNPQLLWPFTSSIPRLFPLSLTYGHIWYLIVRW